VVTVVGVLVLVAAVVMVLVVVGHAGGWIVTGLCFARLGGCGGLGEPVE
jgi:hypothetical protein